MYHKYKAHIGYIFAFWWGAPYVVAVSMLGLMLFLASFNFTVPPIDSGSGGNFNAINKLETKRQDASSMLSHFTGNEAVTFPRQSLSDPSLSLQIFYTIPGLRQTEVGPGLDPLLTPPRLAAIEDFESGLKLLLGFNVTPGTHAPGIGVHCLLRPTDPTLDTCAAAAARPIGDGLTGCLERIDSKPAGWECVEPTSPTHPNTTGPPQLPAGTTPATAALARTIVDLGLPLPCYRNPDVDPTGTVRPQAQSRALNTFVADVLMPYLDGAGGDALRAAGVEMAPFGQGPILYYFQRIIESDLRYVSVAAVMVGLVILIQSRSLFLTATGIGHVVLSYYSAWPFYVLFGFRVLPGLVQMAIFIVLGIGADDIFVLLDAWRRSHHETNSNVNDNLVIKVSVVWARAAKAMFVTTFTTFAAFLATAVSPIPAISAFGVYTAVAVMLNYLYVITWYPAVILIWHRWFEFRWCGRVPDTLKYHPMLKTRAKKEGRNPSDQGSDAVPNDSHPNASTPQGTATSPAAAMASELPDDLIPRNVLGTNVTMSHRSKSHCLTAWVHTIAQHVPSWICRIDRRLADLHPPIGRIMTYIAAAPAEPWQPETLCVRHLSLVERVFYHWVFPTVRLFRLPILLLFIGFGAVCLYFATQLEPEGENRIALDPSHPLSIAFALNDVFSQASRSGDSVCLVYGVHTTNPIDRSGIDPNAADFLGYVVFNASIVFDIPTVEAIARDCRALLETSRGVIEFVSGSSAVSALPPPGHRVAVVFDPNSSRLQDIPCVAPVFLHWLWADRPNATPEALAGGAGCGTTTNTASQLDPEAPFTLDQLNTSAPTEYRHLDPQSVARLADVFLSTPVGRKYTQHIGFVRVPDPGATKPPPERMRWVRDCFTLEAPPRHLPSTAQIRMWDAWVADRAGQSGVAFYHSSRSWVRRVSADAMRQATLLSAGLSLVLVLVVVSLFSGYLILGLVATLAISFILVFIFAYMVWRGWSLEFIESTALTILVGISVDFTVHYAVAYAEAPYRHRQRRTRYALTTMGTSILSGATTTLASAFLLFFATFEFFTKFGEFIFVAILTSFVVANTLFVSLLLFFGPIGHCLDIHYLVKLCLRRLGLGVSLADEHSATSIISASQNPEPLGSPPVPPAPGPSRPPPPSSPSGHVPDVASAAAGSSRAYPETDRPPIPSPPPFTQAGTGLYESPAPPPSSLFTQAGRGLDDSPALPPSSPFVQHHPSMSFDSRVCRPSLGVGIGLSPYSAKDPGGDWAVPSLWVNGSGWGWSVPPSVPRAPSSFSAVRPPHPQQPPACLVDTHPFDCPPTQPIRILGAHYSDVDVEV